MTVLVVGGSGYLGGAICMALAAAGHDVVALSRSGRAARGQAAQGQAAQGQAAQGRAIRGDVTRHNLGLSGAELDRLRAETTHIVSCFGSVNWDAGPAQALDLHAAGIRNVLRFAAGCGRLAGLVHVSSLLALGRAEGRVGNRELYVGQGFRNWYEYGKYHAEALVRAADGLPVTVLRFGPLLGPDPAAESLSARDGLLAAVPFLLQGYPVHLERGGDFPCYAGDVTGAAEVVVRAVRHPADGATWTWFDPELPTLAAVLHGLCRPWGTVPRIMDAPLVGRLQRLMARRVGVPTTLSDYAKPWVELDPAVLDQIPGGPPECRPGYVAATGRALRHSDSDLTGSFA